MIERSTSPPRHSPVCTSTMDTILTDLPSVVASNWKSTDHTLVRCVSERQVRRRRGAPAFAARPLRYAQAARTPQGRRIFLWLMCQPSARASCSGVCLFLVDMVVAEPSCPVTGRQDSYSTWIYRPGSDQAVVCRFPRPVRGLPWITTQRPQAGSRVAAVNTPPSDARDGDQGNSTTRTKTTIDNAHSPQAACDRPVVEVRRPEATCDVAIRRAGQPIARITAPDRLLCGTLLFPATPGKSHCQSGKNLHSDAHAVPHGDQRRACAFDLVRWAPSPGSLAHRTH